MARDSHSFTEINANLFRIFSDKTQYSCGEHDHLLCLRILYDAGRNSSSRVDGRKLIFR